MGLLDVIKKGKTLLEKTAKKEIIIETISEKTGMSVTSILAGIEIYNGIFKKYSRPDYSVYPGMYNIDRFNGKLKRDIITYYSDDVLLTGYFYKSGKTDRLVIVTHGLHAGGDDYLPVIEFFVNNGYNVFAFDTKGTYDSQGDSTVGFAEQLVDLNNTIEFIKNDYRFKNMKLFLFGHSCGGFAVTSVLSLQKDIKAVAAVAPVNNCFTLIPDKGKQYAGNFGNVEIMNTFLTEYQKIIFEGFTDCTGVKGINSTNISVLIAHGIDDKVISLKDQSIIALKHEIVNPSVEYYLGTGTQAGHDSIWHSVEANVYQEKINKGLKTLKDEKKDFSYDDKVEYYMDVDHRLFSDINEDLFNRILKMFNNA